MSPGTGCTLYPTTIIVPFNSLSRFSVVITSNTPVLQTYAVYQTTNTITSSVPTTQTSLTATTNTTATTALSVATPSNSTTSINTSIVTYAGNTNVSVAGDFQLAGSFRNINGTLTQIGSTTTLWTNKNGSLTLPAPNLAASYSISGTNVNVSVTGMQGKFIPTTTAPSVPSLPAAPTFSGTVRAVPGTYATVAAAVTAASAGDIIEIAAGTVTVETSTITVSKSLEIRGVNRSTSGISTTTLSTLLSITPGVNNVWIHDLSLTNPFGGGVGTVINSQTASATYLNGSTGLRFENLNISQRETGIAIGGDSWVINNCYFAYNIPAGDGNTSRHIIDYQTYGTCFVNSCTFDATTEVTPRIIFLYLTSAYIDATHTSGHTGDLIVSGNTQLLGNLRQFLLQDYIKQPALNSDPVASHAFNWYLVNNSCGVTSGGNFIIYEASSLIAPLDFIGTLYVSGNTVGSASTGLVKIDGTGTNRLFGAPTNFYVPNTNYITGTVTSPYVDGCTINNLIGINTTYFFPPTDTFYWKCNALVNSTS